MNNRRDLFWGVMFIAIAAFILLNQLGLVDIVIGTGNIVLAIVFLATLIKSITMVRIFPRLLLYLSRFFSLLDSR